MTVKVNHPQNNRDLYQGLLHLWSKFGDPSLNGWRVIARTSSWLTHRRTDTQTDAGNDNTRRPKLALGKKKNVDHCQYRPVRGPCRYCEIYWTIPHHAICSAILPYAAACEMTCKYTSYPYPSVTFAFNGCLSKLYHGGCDGGPSVRAPNKNVLVSASATVSGERASCFSSFPWTATKLSFWLLLRDNVNWTFTIILNYADDLWSSISIIDSYNII